MAQTFTTPLYTRVPDAVKSAVVGASFSTSAGDKNEITTSLPIAILNQCIEGMLFKYGDFDYLYAFGDSNTLKWIRRSIIIPPAPSGGGGSSVTVEQDLSSHSSTSVPSVAAVANAIPAPVTVEQNLGSHSTSSVPSVAAVVNAIPSPVTVEQNLSSHSSTSVPSVAAVANAIPALPPQYAGTGQNTDGAMTQKAVTDELAKTVHLDGAETVTGNKTFSGYNYFTGYISVPTPAPGSADNGDDRAASTQYVSQLSGRLKTLAFSQPMKRNDLTLRNNITYYLTQDYVTGSPGTSSSVLFSAGSWLPLPTIPTATPSAIQQSVAAGTFVNGVMTTVPTGSLPGMKFFNTSYVYEHMRNDDTSTNSANYVWVRMTKG